MIPAEIVREAKRAESLHGTGHDLPNGTGPLTRHWGGLPASYAVETARYRCDSRTARGDVSWADVLVEEVAEALAESDPAKLRAELVQVAAVASRWIAAIDTRGDQ